MFLRVHNKLPILKDFIKTYGLSSEQIAYMGDDIPDLEALQHVGFSCCPHDASYDVKKTSDYISRKKGGEGCVRDIIEQTLRVNNQWDLNGKVKY